MNYRRLELKLREIVEKRLTEGWELATMKQRGTTAFAREGMCCLLGAAALESDAELPNWGDAVRALGLDDMQEAWALEYGFEGKPFDAERLDRKLYMLGARIRRDYCETT